MMTLKADARELKALAEGLRTAPARMVGPLQVFLGRATSIYQRTWSTLLGAKPFPHYTGEAANSIQTGQAVSFAGNRVTFQGRVYSPLIHVQVLEAGRQPGARRPPTEVITRWAWLRHQRGDIQVSTPAGGSGKALLRAVRSFGFNLARAIGARGIRGKRYARKATKQNKSRVLRELRTLSGALARAMTGRNRGF